MIDPKLFGPGDFISVRAALVREVGAVEALVLARIHYRARREYREAYERDGEWWWRAPSDVLAKETGLTVKQVKRALVVLKDGGYLHAEEHRLTGNYDRGLSYRVALLDRDRPQSPEGPSDSPLGADVPSLQELLPLEGEKNIVVVTRRPAEEVFDRLWDAWPRKANRAGALRMWLRLSLPDQDEAFGSLLLHARHYAEAVAAGMEPTSVPHLQTMVNPANRRWTDEPIHWRPRGKQTPTDRVTAAMGSMLGGPPAGPFPARILPPLGSAHLHMEIES